ncbi:sensor histidine kinase [Allokutzneria sp. NRRL B-24872]|uniref:sensor histidine kinase n=1 Tax=Allokutzneria sp. NRRL B-24872 TaxID=1137961 RepID=UPI001FEF762C|nr:sensor histidine kinase [Allokutzneria sp. NRRL B-24872]
MKKVVDAAAAVFLALLGSYAAVEPPGPPSTLPGWLTSLAACVVALPVAVRRRWPLAVLAVVLGAGLLSTAIGAVGVGVVWVVYAPTVLALYTVASTVDARWAAGAFAVSLAGAGATIYACYPRGTAFEWSTEAVVVGAGMGVAWAAGTVVRWRRETAATFAHQFAREAVVEERLRIARELHDVVGHSMSLIAVKATVANHLADPAESRSALAIIETTSRDALVEIRRVLGVLREDAELRPLSGPADIAELAEAARAAGVRVDTFVSGTEELPDAVGLSVYRIVQESLTNVVKHAAPASCRVIVTESFGTVSIEVTDDGLGHATAGEGHGLIGMRERVSLYGGTFTAGPREGGGFAVVAHLPWKAR